jgi:hypothetical protein
MAKTKTVDMALYMNEKGEKTPKGVMVNRLGLLETLLTNSLLKIAEVSTYRGEEGAKPAVYCAEVDALVKTFKATYAEAWGKPIKGSAPKGGKSKEEKAKELEALAKKFGI